MSKKASTYYPQYSLDGKRSGKKSLIFKHQGVHFYWQIPLLGPTQTQREVMQFAYGRGLPPVIFVCHESPVSTDRMGFIDPYEAHRSYSPYAIAVASVHCVGEEKPRTFEVLFCDIEFHEHNADRHVDESYRGVYVKEVK